MAKGKIVQVIGPVVDIEFPAGELPEILNAITIQGKAGGVDIDLVVEVIELDTDDDGNGATSVEVAVDGDDAVLRVRDDGPGIDPQVRDELFSRFARCPEESIQPLLAAEAEAM